MACFANNLPRDKHCFFSAAGGLSGGKYASLNTNLSSQDDPLRIRKNFKIIAAYFNMVPEDMFTLRQSVSAVAVRADAPSWFEVAADGVVTTAKNILLGIKTADCAPVLLADYENGVIGAAHAGWRGACRGIAENTVKLMLQNGADPQKISAAIGPCLQKESFEVKDDMRQEVISAGKDGEKYFTPSEDGEHFMFDLSGYVENRLRLAGIENICNTRVDTFPLQNGYFSYRRNTKLNLVQVPRDYPTQYSCIRL